MTGQVSAGPQSARCPMAEYSGTDTSRLQQMAGLASNKDPGRGGMKEG